MFETDSDADPLTSALSSRRIPHSRSGTGKGRSGGRGRKARGNGGGSTAFRPLRALGRYHVQLGSSSKHVRQVAQDSEQSSWLEIHELTKEEDGFLATLDFSHGDGRISGMSVLAGSRSNLDKIVSSLESGQLEDLSDDRNRADSESDSNYNADAAASSKAASDDDDDDDDDDDQGDQKSALELADERHNKRIRAFEKNTFRNPKFWMRWRGQVETSNSSQSPTNSATTPITLEGAAVETNQSYVIFAGNSCDKFEGTITCQTLGWENLKVHGWKITSRPSPCPLMWLDIGRQQPELPPD